MPDGDALPRGSLQTESQREIEQSGGAIGASQTTRNCTPKVMALLCLVVVTLCISIPLCINSLKYLGNELGVLPDTSSSAGSVAACTNTCNFASDGSCDDGGLGSEFSLCRIAGSDCDDCGARCRTPACDGSSRTPPSPPLAPTPPHAPYQPVETQWWPSIGALIFWSLMMPCILPVLICPAAFMRCQRKSPLAAMNPIPEEQLAESEAMNEWMSANSSFSDSEISWGLREGDKDDPRRVKKATKVDHAKLIFLTSLEIYGMCAVSFLPAVPWARTGLPQFFTLLLSPISAIIEGGSSESGRQLSVVSDVAFDAEQESGLNLALLYFYFVVGIFCVLAFGPSLIALFGVAVDTATGAVTVGCMSSFNKGIMAVHKYVFGAQLKTILRPLLSPWVCEVPPWGGPAIMNIDRLSEIGSPQFCFGLNWAHWIACLVSLCLTPAVMIMPFVLLKIQAALSSREKGVFLRHLKPVIMDANPNSKMLTEKMQRTLMRVVDSEFQGKTYTKLFLSCRAVVAIVTAFLSLGSNPSAVVIPSLLGNLFIWGVVITKKPCTDERENILYRDLMVIPVWSNIVALIAVGNPDSPGLPALWFLIVLLVMVPAAAFHFYKSMPKDSDGESPDAKMVKESNQSGAERENV